MSRQLFIHAGRKPLVEQRVKSCARSLHSDWRDFVSQRMLQSGLVVLQQYFPDGLFRRVKSDPLIIISALLVLSRDLIRISPMSALLTLKLVPFAVRLIQVTAFRTGLRGVRRIDLLSTASGPPTP